MMDRPFSASRHLSHSWLNHQRNKVPKQSGNILKRKGTISACPAEVAAPGLVLLINLSAAGGDEPVSRQGPSTSSHTAWMGSKAPFASLGAVPEANTHIYLYLSI